jgi:hypothetical protein
MLNNALLRKVYSLVLKIYEECGLKKFTFNQ